MHRDVVPLTFADDARAIADKAARALAEVSANGLVLLDEHGCFGTVNGAAARILGLAAADLIGVASPFAVSEDDNMPEQRRGCVWTTPDGRRRDLDYRYVPVPGAGHAVWFNDVTDTRRQQERLTAIVRAASSVADAGSLRATLDAVAQEIQQTSNIAAVQILAVDSPRDELRVLGMAGFGDATGFIERLRACRKRGARVRFLDALEGGEPVVVPDRKRAVMSDPDWAPLHTIMDYPDWDSFVSLPMAVRGHTVGVINAYYAPGEDPGANSLAFLGAMADHAAVAIDTASLLSRARSQAQLDERRRLARELHDSVVQQLFSMRMQAQALRSGLDHPEWNPEEMYRGAEELAEFSQHALADLRRLVFELHPLDLDEQGLIDAVREYAAGLRARARLAVDVRASADLALSYGPDVQEDLYRIVQEALHNVEKHADALSAQVVFDVSDHRLVVEVADDGRGDDGSPGSQREGTAAQRSLGLVSMRERAERWGGRMEAGPRPGGGWRVRVIVPTNDRQPNGPATEETDE